MGNSKSDAIKAYALAQVGGPYIYGATARPCTIGYRNARMEQYPEYEAKIRDSCPALSGEGVGCSGCRHEGRLAHDCAQLTRYAAKTAGLTLPSGATTQWRSGDWIATGPCVTLPGNYVCFLYRQNGDGTMKHTGVYLGDGTVIDARGHQDGVLHTDFAAYPWTHWAILRGMDCPEGQVTTSAPVILRKGMSGDAVADLQEKLRAAGYALDVDGIFGKATRAAVMELQRDAGVSIDGVAGPVTMAALSALDGCGYTVVIRSLNKLQAARILHDYGGEIIGQSSDEEWLEGAMRNE